MQYYLKVSESDYDKAAGLEGKELPKPTQADYDRAANPQPESPPPTGPAASESDGK